MPLGPPNHLVHQLAQWDRAGKQIESPVQGRMIGSLLHADCFQPFGHIFEQCLSAAIALLLHLAKDQACEELRKSKVMSAEARRVLRKRAISEGVGNNHHRPWRFAGFHPASCTITEEAALPYKRRTLRGSRQSQSGVFDWSGMSVVGPAVE